MSRFSRGAGSTRGPGKCVLTAGRPSAVPVTPVCLVSELVSFLVRSLQLLPPGSSLKYLQGPRVSQGVLGELRFILLNGGNESGCDQLPSGPLSRACGESRLENVAGELGSWPHMDTGRKQMSVISVLISSVSTILGEIGHWLLECSLRSERARAPV